LISKILRGAAWLGLILVVLLVAAVIAFRLAASLRETAARADLAPPSGHWVATRSGDVFIQEKGPPTGVPVVLFHGTAAWSEFVATHDRCARIRGLPRDRA
jgi:hypothetical protein